LGWVGGTSGSAKGATKTELRTAEWDVDVGMLFSISIMYFIMLATGATLFKAGTKAIASAVEAAHELRPLAGDAAGLLFALGLVGTGFLAVPILTGSAAYAVAEAWGWRSGLDERL
jgi:Mn2+/Fe2+ NRAMP family transporter